MITDKVAPAYGKPPQHKEWKFPKVKPELVSKPEQVQVEAQGLTGGLEQET